MSLGEQEPVAPGEPGPRGSRRSAWARRARSAAIDLTPLRTSLDFRRLMAGDAVSVVGTQMTIVAIPLQVYAITGSSFAVGLIGLFAVVPLIVFGLIGGAIADAHDRRRLLIRTQAGLAAVSGLLVLQALLHNRQVWVLYLLVFCLSALFAIDSPARRAVTPRLLPVDQFAAAATLGQLLFNFGVIAGPLLAGGIVGTVGVTWVYLLDLASFAASMYAAWSLPVLAPEGGGTRAGVASVLEGFRFLRGRRNVLMTFAVDINAMVFGMPRALFPAWAVTVYHGGPRTAGLLYAAPAMGALLGALVGGLFSRVHRQGLGVLVSVTVWGAAIAAFGFTRSLWLGVLMLAVAGAADMVSAVFRTAILNAATPDEMRGRLSGVFIVVVAGGPRVGDLEAGTVAAVVSPQFSVVSGGVACIGGVALLAALVPSFSRYDARDPVP